MQTKFFTGVFALILSLALMPGLGNAQISPELVRNAASASGLQSLKTVPIPPVENLGDFLKPGTAARTAAIRLGKALFWDMQVGSDGQACASCHFHAGADSRARNQLSPGLLGGDTLFGNNDLGVQGFPQFQPDYTLQATNFPFHVLADPEENNFNLREVQRDTNDVTSSMGAFAADFDGIEAPLLDDGTRFVDEIFNKNNPSAIAIDKNVRRVEPRNTPTMINAVFNHSNFWDGRAHNLFNGVSVIGPLDPEAMIWVVGRAGRLEQKQVRIPNSSLASQAVGPPTSNLEMSFFNRPFPMIGRKLLALTPLGQQIVSLGDSVLGGSLSKFPQTGLNTSYTALIQAAFQSKYWDSTRRTPADFTLMEANFTLFFGLAVQMYETSLVSNDSPFDQFMDGDNDALSQEQLQGLLVFLNRGARGNLPEVNTAIAAAGIPIGAGNCVSCHGSPLFTDAAFPALEEAPGELELIEIEDTTCLGDGGIICIDGGGFLTLNTGVQGLLDNGFSNIGVRPTASDLGRGGEVGGVPLSFVRQMLDFPDLLDGVIEKLDFPCRPGRTCPEQLLVDGAFKIPGLRNVELTGPYFHNGGQATLSQVVEFYDRQSDFADFNIDMVDRNMVFINLADSDEEPLVEFLLSLTDDRVRNKKAPFDHPQLIVPNGGTFASPAAPIVIPAVGANGSPAPLGTFLGLEHVD